LAAAATERGVRAVLRPQIPAVAALPAADPEIDLRFATLMRDLACRKAAHDAVNDAVMAALAFIKLRQLQGAR
jgi:hypothetical protein